LRLCVTGTRSRKRLKFSVMAEPRPHVPVLLVVAAFSRHVEALTWARQRLEQDFGPVAHVSAPYDFNQTTYYAATMGSELRKQFFAFHNLVAADDLAAIQLRTNALEDELARASG